MKLSLKIKSFYEKEFNKEVELGELAELRIKKLLSLVGSKKRVLDVGCYDGTITLRIKKLGNEVVGIDISKRSVELARKNGAGIYLSTSREEPFGLVFIESWCSGIPVLATKTEGSKDILVEGKKWLVDKTSIIGIYQALLKI